MTTSNNRIVLDKLLEVWSVYPEMRLGQLLDNATYMEDDLFYISNQKLLDRLQEFAEKVMAEPEEE